MLESQFTSLECAIPHGTFIMGKLVLLLGELALFWQHASSTQPLT